jgi:hypothetical protein
MSSFRKLKRAKNIRSVGNSIAEHTPAMPRRSTVGSSQKQKKKMYFYRRRRYGAFERPARHASQGHRARK